MYYILRANLTRTPINGNSHDHDSEILGRVQRPPAPIRALVIDLGTNSFHAVIVDAHANGSFVLLDQRKELVELGQLGLSKHWLSEEAIERGVSALGRIKVLGDGWGVEDHLAFATSAIREARNGGEFISRVWHELGIRVRAISGEREAALIYEGVRIAVNMPRPSLIVDIGGGSTEFVVATSDESFFEMSLKLGAARLTEQAVHGDPIHDDALGQLRMILRRQLEPVLVAAKARDVQTLVGSSGSMHNLMEVAVDQAGDRGRTVFQQTVDASIMKDVLNELIHSPRSDRLGIAGLDPKRVDQIVAAAALVHMLLDELPIQRIVASPNALREGMVVHFIQQNHDRLEQLAPFGDVRLRSINQLGFRCQWEFRHAQHVKTLALELFDACTSLHGCGQHERELLEYASLLHDIGYHISRSSHHKHSYYIISNADLNGFQPEEIETIAHDPA